MGEGALGGGGGGGGFTSRRSVRTLADLPLNLCNDTHKIQNVNNVQVSIAKSGDTTRNLVLSQ